MTGSSRRSGRAHQAAARPARRPRALPKPAPDISAEVAAEVVAAVNQYRPKGDAHLYWDRIETLTREAVLAARPVSVDRARQLLGVVAHLLAWRVEHEHTINAADAFSLPGLDAYLATKGTTQSARAIRSRLLSVSEALGVISDSDVSVLPPLPKTPVATPYTLTEVATLLAWCDSHDLGDRVLAGICLGAGAGLDGREQHQVTGRDIVIGTRSVLVRAPGVRQAAGAASARPMRLVPVVAEFENDLARLALLAGDKPLIGEVAAASRDYGKLADLVDVALPRLNAGRLRATWLASRLAASVPLMALTAAGAGQVDRTLHALAKPVDARVFQDALRGTRCCGTCPGAEPFDPGRYPDHEHVTDDTLAQRLGGAA